MAMLKTSYTVYGNNKNTQLSQRLQATSLPIIDPVAQVTLKR
jgi:hypothetical protein